MQHVLFFAGYQLKAFAVQKGCVSHCDVFSPDEQGYAEFEQYLLSQVVKPVRLLVDVIEEDFHLDTVPHVMGKDRRALQQRLLNKYLRGAEHRYIEVQGRETEGRRDDQLLIAGISNSELLRPWLDILDRQHIALAGIHSLPLVGQEVLPELASAENNVLLISQQVPTSVRHSLYQNGQLKMSRLAPALGDEGESAEQLAAREINKTIRYLENQRLFSSAQGQQALDIYALSPGQKIDVPGIKILPLPTGELFADHCFVRLLLKHRRPINHYGHDKNLSIYYHKQAALGLNVAALVLLLCSVMAAVYLKYHQVRQEHAVPQFKLEAQKYRESYAARIGALGKLNLEAQDVQRGVESLEALQRQYSAMPQSFLNALAQVTGQFPAVSYQHIKWSVADQLQVAGDVVTPAPFSAVVDATLLEFADSPRKALQQVEALLKALRNHPGFASVQAVKMPFDLGADSQFKMHSASQEQNLGTAEFSFHIRGRLP